MKKLIVFDVDGTLADNTTRQKLLQEKPKKWKEYKQRILEDVPIQETIFFLKLCYSAGHHVVIVTARTEDERNHTEEWFKLHGIFNHYDKMYMRENLDYRDDSIIKSELLNRLKEDYNQSPFVIFDDRDRVVKMWRENGIKCFQVNYGNF